MVDKPIVSRAQLKQETPVKPHFSPAQLKNTDKHIGIIHLISGTTAKGEDFFAYISVKPSLYEEFLSKMENGIRMDVDKYGKVLKKGYGKNPSAEVQQELIDKFGLDPNFMEHLTAEIEKRQNAKKK